MKWISWYQPTDDHRPVNYPPTEKVLAWWCTGHSAAHGATLVALIDVHNQEQAEHHVKLNWPEAEKWRFCVDKNDKVFGDRLPVQDWMIERGCSNHEVKV